jgi:integrase
MPGKRRFGRVRRLRSGRWQARYRAPDGIDRPAPRTFEFKTDAERWLALMEAEIVRGDWIDPNAGRVSFGNYAETWVEERPGLRAKTIELYRYLLRRHLAPTLGPMAVADISEQRVRAWRKSRLDAGASPITVAKAYRLLKAVLNTAVDDGLVRRNPCRVKGAGQEKSPERQVLSMRDVGALADAIDQRYRVLILLAIFCSLRWGELAALRRSDIDLTARTVRITRQVTTLSGGRQVIGPPKSGAGNRVVVVPEIIIAPLQLHLRWSAEPGDDGLLFTSPAGQSLRYDNFRNRFWYPALRAAGLPRVHFHDLRHTGNQLAADAGASLRELMDRMGHSTARAAMIYLHGSDERQRAIADAISQRVASEFQPEPPNRSGTHRAQKSGRAS